MKLRSCSLVAVDRTAILAVMQKHTPRSRRGPKATSRLDPLTGVPANFDHDRFIRSKRWIDRRDRYFSEHPKKCARCDTQKRIHLHHKTYERVGAELNEDLTPLCELCHSIVHKAFRCGPFLATDRRPTLAEVTEVEIRRGREALKELRAAGRATKTKTGSVRGEFVPARQRMTLEERKNSITSGREGRLGGLPIRTI